MVNWKSSAADQLINGDLARLPYMQIWQRDSQNHENLFGLIAIAKLIERHKKPRLEFAALLQSFATDGLLDFAINRSQLLRCGLGRNPTKTRSDFLDLSRHLGTGPYQSFEATLESAFLSVPV